MVEVSLEVRRIYGHQNTVRNLALAQTKSAQPTKPALPPATAPVQRWHGGQKTITDAAGRVHVRGERITYAQRKSAAERRVKAMREAAAKKKLAEVKQ